jgi:anti-anti-sigma factor
MSIQTEIRGQILIIRPEGCLNKAISSELEELLTNELDEGFRQIVFDFSLINQISSDGLRVILRMVNEVRSLEGDVAITGVLEQVETALDVTGFFKLIDSFPDIETAIESLLEIDQDSD